MIVIGITGTLGAGKGTIVKYLVNNMGFGHFSVREYLVGKIKHHKMPLNRDSMTSLANELRTMHSPSYIVDQLFEEAVKTNSNAVIESIRTAGEIYSLREKGTFYLFAVDADPMIRYKRIKNRNTETDDVSFETFMENEQREYSNEDPNMQNLKKCIELADYAFINDKSIDDLYAKISKTIKKMHIK